MALVVIMAVAEACRSSPKDHARRVIIADSSCPRPPCCLAGAVTEDSPGLLAVLARATDPRHRR